MKRSSNRYYELGGRLVLLKTKHGTGNATVFHPDSREPKLVRFSDLVPLDYEYNQHPDWPKLFFIINKAVIVPL